MLFGRTILTEQQMNRSGATSPAATGNSSTCWNAEKGPNASEGSGGSGVIQTSPAKAASSERPPWLGGDGSQ